MNLLRSLALAIALFAFAPAAALAGPPSWDLKSEFKTAEGSANPQADGAGVADVWRFAETAGSGTYSLFEYFGQQAGWDVMAWGADPHAAAPPFVGKTTAAGVGVEESGEIVVHPAPGRNAAAGWRSTTAQTVNWQGYLNHAFPGNGDGVSYSVVKQPVVGVAQQLAAGQTDGANTTGMLGATGISLQAGDVIWFSVGAGSSDNADHDLVSMMFFVSGAGTGTDPGKEEPSETHDPGTEPTAPQVPADTTKPALRILAPANGRSVNDRTPTVIGCAGKASGDSTTVQLDVLSGTHVVQSTQVATVVRSIVAERACKSPAFTADVPADLADGSYTLRARQADAAGNVGEDARTIAIDGTPPRVRIKEPRNGRLVRTSRPVFAGSAGADGAASVEVAISKLRSPGSVYVRAWGTRKDTKWQAQPDAFTSLPDGMYVAQAFLADAAGNRGRSQRIRFKVNEKPPAPKAPRNLSIVGDIDVGAVVGISGGDWSPRGKVALSYEWLRCFPDNGGCDVIRGANRPEYRITDADRRRHLRVVVTGKNESGRDSVWSSQTRAVPPPPVFPRLEGKPPTITGTPRVGETLDALSGEWRATTPVRWAYQWQQCQWETLCFDIRGANSRKYKVQPGDAGHKLQVLVWISNKAGTASARSGKTVQVKAGAEQRRRADVRNSYLIAFGRLPSQGEEDYWTKNRSESLDQMVANHRSFIRGNYSEARSVTQLAYKKVFGWSQPTLTQQPRFAEDVAAEQREGLTYEQLVDKLARRFVKQAYEKIFFWDPTLRAGPSSKVEHYVGLIKSEFFDHKGAGRGDAIWSAIALSNDPIRGAARTSYSDGAKGAAQREVCFGAIGPSCAGAGPNLSGGWAVDHFMRDDGTRMSYVKIETAVGSILHDAICRTYVGGAWCKQDVGNTLRAEFPFSKWFDKATPEWDKATFGTLTGRKWFELYGPYPADQSVLFLKGIMPSGGYSDDLRPVARQKRWAEVSPGGIALGIGASLMPSRGWGGREMRASTRLAAPRDTILDWSDKDFCESGRFQSKSALEQAVDGIGSLSRITLVSQYRRYGRCA